MQELLDELKVDRAEAKTDSAIAYIDGLIEFIVTDLVLYEKEFITNFTMDYVFSGNVGFAQWAGGPPELDIEKSARDYYTEYIHTISLDSTNWSNNEEK